MNKIAIKVGYEQGYPGYYLVVDDPTGKILMSDDHVDAGFRKFVDSGALAAAWEKFKSGAVSTNWPDNCP